MATVLLTGSVGNGGANATNDVKTVRDRLVALGFDWIRGTTTGKERDFIRVITLFQCICRGYHKLKVQKGVDGRVDLKGSTHKWLAAQNAPSWVKFYGKSGFGWKTTVETGKASSGGTAYTQSNGGYGVSWMMSGLWWAGMHYFASMLLDHTLPPMWVRDCSPQKGGPASGHGSHQTGIDLDIRLPLRPTAAGDVNTNWTFLGARGYKDKRYYREAAEKQLRAIKQGMRVKFVFFNDKTLIAKGLCQYESNHQHHYHIRIKPPAMIPGVI